MDRYHQQKIIQIMEKRFKDFCLELIQEIDVVSRHKPRIAGFRLKSDLSQVHHHDKPGSVQIELIDGVVRFFAFGDGGEKIELVPMYEGETDWDEESEEQ